jgi:hypothetical protein
MLDLTQLNMKHVPVEGYHYYNYALLHTVGYTHVLDTMRYERAFFARATDVQRMLGAVEDIAEWATRRVAILLSKYDFRGKTKANWTPQRLLSTQELEIITDPYQLLQLNADDTSLRPPKKLKVQHVLPVEGTVEWILRVMFLNKAMPASENDAHTLERAFMDRQRTPTIELTNFCVSKTVWTLPPRNDPWATSTN